MKALVLFLLLVLPVAAFAVGRPKPFSWLHDRSCAKGVDVCYLPVGFKDAKISLDGSMVGWIVDSSESNRAYPYPTPMELDVRDLAGKIHVFYPDSGVIVGWCFSKDSRAVAFSRTTLHGPTDEFFELRRVVDGKLLKQFDLPWKQLDGQLSGLPMQIRIPGWALCAATYPAQDAAADR
jgi:hypothetical protein